MKLATKLLAAAWMVVCAACAEVTEPQRTEFSIESEQIPPEYDIEPSIAQYAMDVGFLGGNAWGQATMQYYGNRAEQRVNITLRDDAGEIGTAEGRSVQHNIFPVIHPYTRHLASSTGLALNNSCTFYLNGTSHHSAWHEFVTKSGGVLSWSRSERSDWKTATHTVGHNQTGMPTPGHSNSYDPGTSCGSVPGGGSSGSYTCTTIETDHYWYYPDTGQIEYRYTSYTTICYINAE